MNSQCFSDNMINNVCIFDKDICHEEDNEDLVIDLEYNSYEINSFKIICNNIDIISKIELIIGKRSIQKLSGNFLQTYQHLSGDQYILPFCKIPLSRLQYNNISIKIKIKQYHKKIGQVKTTKDLIKLVSGYDHIKVDNNLPYDIVNLIGEYCFISNIKIYTQQIYMKSNVQYNPILNSFFINEFQQRCYRVKKNKRFRSFKLDFNHLVKKIIFEFRDSNGEYVDVLHNGKFMINYVCHKLFNNYDVRIIDKIMFEEHVSKQPIYTITFDKGLDIDNMKRPSSFLDFSKVNNCYIDLHFFAKEDLTLNVYAISVNRIINNNGVAYLSVL